MTFEQEYVRCVRNEEECVCSVCVCSAPKFHCNILINGKIIKERLGSVASGTHCITNVYYIKILKLFSNTSVVNG